MKTAVHLIIECSQNVYFMVGNMEDFLNLDKVYKNKNEIRYNKTAERSEYKAYSMKNYLCMSIITKKSSKNADLRENYGYFPSKIFIYTQKVKMNRD